jgi:two-component system, chemotaxis family, chemotaxis protein CheY
LPTVLLVEDDSDLRHTIAEVLVGEGYECEGAQTATQAIDYLNSHHPPCMVLLDLGLPGMDGLSFIRWVSQQPTLRAVPIGVISGQARRRESELAPFRDHVVQVMSKPFEIDAVLKILEQHCGAPPHPPHTGRKQQSAG